MAGQNNFQDEWDNWNVIEEPEPRNRWLIGLLIGAVAVCLIAACGVGGYYFVWPALAPATPPPRPPVPTLPGAPETATAEAATAVAATGGTATQATATTAPAGPTTAPVEASATPTATETAPPPAPSEVVAIQANTAPTIDGALNEYAAAPAIPSAFRVYSAGSWDGSADLNATWRLLWDAQNLYVGVTVVDDIHVQNQSGNQIFRGDSVDIQVDTAPEANAAQVNPETYQIILSPGDFGALGESAFRFQGTESGQIVDAPGHDIAVAAQPTADGYTLEASIPWNNLDVTPAEGLRLGLALNANDNDQPGEAIQEVMMSSVSTRTLTNPRSWGSLTLR